MKKAYSRMKDKGGREGGARSEKESLGEEELEVSMIKVHGIMCEITEG